MARRGRAVEHGCLIHNPKAKFPWLWITITPIENDVRGLSLTDHEGIALRSASPVVVKTYIENAETHESTYVVFANDGAISPAPAGKVVGKLATREKVKKVRKTV